MCQGKFPNTVFNDYIPGVPFFCILAEKIKRKLKGKGKGKKIPILHNHKADEQNPE